MLNFPEIKLPDGTAFTPKRVWFPTTNQLLVIMNENWAHSAWLGVFYSIFYLPTMIGTLILFPFALGIWKVLNIVFGTLLRGFTGELDAYNLPPGVVMMVRPKGDDQ